MNILCIETSAGLCSVALVKGDEIFYEEDLNIMSHAEVLMTLIQRCLMQANIETFNLNAIAISGGPGSYTGLRIGCSTAKGICYSLGIPLIAINTLKIIASSAKKKYSNETYYWAMTDARRMEVYHAVFNQNLEQITPSVSGVITETDFRPSMINEKTILCGDGASKAVSVLNLKDAEVIANAESICQLAIEAYLQNNFVDLAYYEPFYLKKANITAAKS